MKRVILGTRNSGEQGLWISKPGADAMSTNVDDFLISMSAETGMVIMAGYLTSFTDTGRTLFGQKIWGAQVSHGLGYVPLFVSCLVGDFLLNNGSRLAFAATADESRLMVNFGASDISFYNGMMVYYTVFRTQMR